MSDKDGIPSIADKVLSGQVSISTGIKKTRPYNEISEKLFSNDTLFIIKETDSYLLRFLKKELIDGGYKYSDFLGIEKITYSTFYNMGKSGKINYEMFERFMRIAGLKFEISLIPEEVASE